MTFFDVDDTLTLSNIADMAALQETMNGAVKELGANCFYVVKIEGTFDSIKVRSEYKQEKPYRHWTRRWPRTRQSSITKTSAARSSACTARITWAT